MYIGDNPRTKPTDLELRRFDSQTFIECLHLNKEWHCTSGKHSYPGFWKRGKSWKSHYNPIKEKK